MSGRKFTIFITVVGLVVAVLYVWGALAQLTGVTP